MRKTPLTVERLRYLLDYDPAMGVFVWKHPLATSMKPGTRAGTKRERGYRRIAIDGQKHQESVLAWMYVHGSKPSRVLRFKNGDTSDSRIDNLAFGEFYYSTPEGRRAYERADRQKPSKADRYKNADLKKFFGITLDQYRDMLVMQAGVCMICGRPETMIRRGRVQSLSVDHNHDTMQVRDLLCTSCNAMVGYSRERPDLLRAAAAYLERHASEEERHRGNVTPFPQKDSA